MKAKSISLIIILILIPIFIQILIVSIYELTTEEYTIQENMSSVTINNNTYNFTSPYWEYNELDKRIGYIKRDNSLPNIFYVPFKHGLYSLKDDPNNMFYQIQKVNACKDYVLLAREDVDLALPNASDVVYIKNVSGKKITDKDVIEELMTVLQTASCTEVSTPYSINCIEVYTSKYPGIHLTVELYEDKNNKWYVSTFINDYVVIPIQYELAEKLTN